MRCSHRVAQGGFSLVELMVVTAISAILASVAVPAYINYVNRVKQSEAASYLLSAKLEMEEFYADNRRYTGTIGCLPTFRPAGSTACLTNCASCAATSRTLARGADNLYTFSTSLIGNEYRLHASKKYYNYARTDWVYVSSTRPTITVPRPETIKFSLVQWLMDNQ
jgi:type IV pilus assembly protein PilE